MRRPTLLAHFAALLVIVLAGRAAADNTVGGKAEALMNQGLAFYQAGEYQKAAALFQQAYAAEPTPRLAFNIARAYEKAGATALAASYYELYVTSPDPEPEVLARAKEGLARTRERSKSEPPSARPSPPPPPKDPAPAEKPTQGSSRAASYVLWGVGGAALLAGGAVALWANGTASEAGASRDPVERPRLRDAAYDRAIAADITLGAGVVLCVVGIIVYFASNGRGEGQSNTALRSLSEGPTWRF